MVSRERRNSASLLLLVGTLVPLAILGCSQEGEQSAPPALVGAGGHGGAPPWTGFCEEDQDYTRDCTVYIEQGNGVTSCFNGIQYCDAGDWTDCLDPDHDPRVR